MIMIEGLAADEKRGRGGNGEREGEGEGRGGVTDRVGTYLLSRGRDPLQKGEQRLEWVSKRLGKVCLVTQELGGGYF